MKRWFLRIGLLLVTLAVVLGVSVEITLRSDLPRRIVLDILQQQTGLRIEADSLRTGWTGRTTVEGLTVALPREADPFLSVPPVEITHTNLIMLAIRQRIEIVTSDVDRPRVTVKSDDRGQWNVLRALDLIARAPGPAEPDAAISVMLPHVSIRAARLDVQRPDGAFARYEPLSVVGTPQHDLDWRFEVSAQRWRENGPDDGSAKKVHDPQIILTGHIAPHPTWSHTMTFDVDEVPKLIEPWLPDLPEPLRFAGEWRGEVRDAALNGQLVLDDLVVADASATGAFEVALDGRELIITPTDVRFSMARSPVRDARIDGGTIRTDGRRFAIDRLIAEAIGTKARLSAAYDRDTERGDVRIAWRGRAVDVNIQHEGTFTGQFDLPPFGRSRMRGTVSFAGDSPHGSWNSALDIDASGDSWRELNGRIVAPRLLWTDAVGEVDLSGLAARVRSNWPVVTLSRLTIPDAAGHGAGSINMETMAWQASLDARDWSFPPRVRALWRELSGADVATVPFDVIRSMMKHPLTDIGLEKFVSDYKKAFG